VSFKDKYFHKTDSFYPNKICIKIGDLVIEYEKVFDLRYGTNPHQPASYYKITNSELFLGNMEILKTGKDGLSQTNIEDANQAYKILKYFNRPSVAIMKHLNPSGVAVQNGEESLKTVYIKAREADPQAAFGGSVIFNCRVDGETAEEIMQTVVENVFAPEFSSEAIETFNNFDKYKKNKQIRIIRVKNINKLPRFKDDKALPEIKILQDGSLILAEQYLTKIRSEKDFIKAYYKDDKEKIIIKRDPTDKEIKDLLFAWYVNIGVRSNSIVIAKDGVTLAVGTGEQDRVGALEQAINKARTKCKLGISLEGSVLASDGFFPFRDSIDLAASVGIKAIVQPGGSLRDKEVIQACNEHGISMVFTDERSFSHH